MADYFSDTHFLVTGGAGFIGSHLCESLLKTGYCVWCLDDFSTGSRDNIAPFLGDSRFFLIEGDIRNFDDCMEACKDIDYVLHQAAWGSVPRSIEMPLLYEEINAKGTLNMLEAARRRKVKRFVYASSSSVYGDSTVLPKKEGTEGNPLSPYACTKRANEEVAALYSRIYGLETFGLRYFNVFGPRQSPAGPYAAAIPKFCELLSKNEAPAIFGDGLQTRDFTYVSNVVAANFKAACIAPSAYSGQVFNIAYGGSETLLSMYNALCSQLKKDLPPGLFPAAQR